MSIFRDGFIKRTAIEDVSSKAILFMKLPLKIFNFQSRSLRRIAAINLLTTPKNRPT